MNALAADRKTRFNCRRTNSFTYCLSKFEKDFAMKNFYSLLAASVLSLGIGMVAPSQAQEKKATVTFESITLETAQPCRYRG